MKPPLLAGNPYQEAAMPRLLEVSLTGEPPPSFHISHDFSGPYVSYHEGSKLTEAELTLPTLLTTLSRGGSGG